MHSSTSLILSTSSTQSLSSTVQSTASSAYQSLPNSNQIQEPLSNAAGKLGLGAVAGSGATSTQETRSREDSLSSSKVSTEGSGDEKSLKERARAQSLAAGREYT